MHLGLVSTRPPCVHIDRHIAILDTQDPDEYGKLLSWNKFATWTGKDQQYLPGEALLVLEAQEGLLSFLVHCCRLILADIAYDVLARPSFPAQPNPPLEIRIDANGFESFLIKAAAGPYGPPSEMDFGRIETY
ncbi:hypothetical protein F4859DRAFT_508450 [Xylaria cf. heliscus]|nr:hypothetical protein F4859DRAFT_508450 [Xylaria cf. heliscus]